MSTSGPLWLSLCPSCRAADIQPLTRYERAHLARCRGCGLTFARRRPSLDELSAHYEHYGTAWRDSEITRARYRELLDQLEPFRRLNRLLDFGCGAGYFLDEARARGWEVAGTEYGAHARELAAGRGLNVIDAGLAAEVLDASSFDVITAFEVVEHVLEPRAEASLVARWLRPGGAFYCTTPNFNSLSRRVLREQWPVIEYPEHLNYFTRASLISWLRQAGFALEHVETTGFSPSVFRVAMDGRSGEPAQPASASADERLRAASERSPWLGSLKRATNMVLTGFAAGDTLKGTFRRL